MDKQYKVISPYTSYCFGFPLTIPVGSIGRWFEHGGCYVFDSVEFEGQRYSPFVGKWAVESWHMYFEEATHAHQSNP